MSTRERTSAAVVSAEAVESLIRELPGVLGARLVINDWGGVREIHVLADASRQAKSVVRDIESALMARWSLQVDHKRISVAQVVDAPRRGRSVRLRVRRLTVATDAVRGETEVAVGLAPAAEERSFGQPERAAAEPAEAWEGRARGEANPGAIPRLMMAATVAAVNEAMLPGHRFALVDAAPASIGGHELVNVLIRYRAPRGFSQLLAGVAVVRSGGLDAGVRAVLQAINRVAGPSIRPRGEDAGGAGATATESEAELDEDAAEEVAASQEPGEAGWHT